MREALDRHCRKVVRAMADGSVVPLLGAGANLCDRPPDAEPEAGRFLPSGAELARSLAAKFDYPLDDTWDLVRVSQYVDLSCGEGPLYDRLHDVFDQDYPPTFLHRFLAELPARMETLGYGRRHQLVVTTNYDDMLERAYAEAGEPFDVLIYMARAKHPHHGRLLHVTPDGDLRRITRANEYRELSLDRESVILKIHGAVSRDDQDEDSYVITEDHYIEYLTHTNLNGLIPARILARLMRSHFLFLGYRMRDWNLRVILHRIWEARDLGYRSWAVQREPDPVDEELWRRREVDVYDVPLADYVAELERALEALAAAPA